MNVEYVYKYRTQNHLTVVEGSIKAVVANIKQSIGNKM